MAVMFESLLQRKHAVSKSEMQELQDGCLQSNKDMLTVFLFLSPFEEYTDLALHSYY